MRVRINNDSTSRTASSIHARAHILTSAARLAVISGVISGDIIGKALCQGACDGIGHCYCKDAVRAYDIIIACIIMQVAYYK